jgi:hypothetical protein
MRLQPIGRGPAQDLVLLGEVGPAVADTVALGERPVEQDVIGIRLAQDPQQSACSAGQVLDDGLDVGMGGTDGNAEARGDLRERLMFAKVDQADLSVRQVECGRTGTQRGTCADELIRRAHLATARKPRELRDASPSPDQ